jgi:membrane associated rhomboid family serine protease
MFKVMGLGMYSLTFEVPLVMVSRFVMVFLGLLLLSYIFYALFILDSLYPASAVMPGTGGIVNLMAHFVGMVAGYFLTCLYTALARNNSLYS